jgi:hypothetical protein
VVEREESYEVDCMNLPRSDVIVPIASKRLPGAP